MDVDYSIVIPAYDEEADLPETLAALRRAMGARQIARARKVGGHAAHGRWLVFVDADSHIGPELLRSALAALDGGEVCGGGARLALESSIRVSPSMR